MTTLTTLNNRTGQFLPIPRGICKIRLSPHPTVAASSRLPLLADRRRLAACGDGRGAEGERLPHKTTRRVEAPATLVSAAMAPSAAGEAAGSPSAAGERDRRLGWKRAGRRRRGAPGSPGEPLSARQGSRGSGFQHHGERQPPRTAPRSQAKRRGRRRGWAGLTPRFPASASAQMCTAGRAGSRPALRPGGI